MKNPKVSIITPSFNSGKYIEQTIKSVQSQTYKDIEYIIMDGNSTDKTKDIVANYPWVRFYQEKDEGMYDAINKGINISSGEVVCYLNADDVLNHNAVKDVVEAMEHNDSDVVVGYCNYIDGEGNFLFKSRIPFLKSGICRSLGRMPFSQPSVFWKKSCHDKIGYFDIKYKYSADFDFFIHLTDKYNPHLIRNSLSSFRLHDRQLTRDKDNMRNETLDILKDNNVKPTFSPLASVRFIKLSSFSVFRIIFEFLYTLINFKSIIYYFGRR